MIAGNDNDIHMGFSELSNKSGTKSKCSPYSGPIDNEVLAFNEARPPKLIEHRDKNRILSTWTVGQAADAIGPPRFLRHRRERPCDSRACKRDELAPPHRFPRAETLFCLVG